VGKWLHHDRWLTALLDRLATAYPGQPFTFFAVPVAGALLVLVALWQLPFWLAFLMGIVVLLFSVGRGDWHSGLADLAGQLRDGNAEAVWLMLEQEGVVSDGNGEPGQGLWLAWRRHAGCWYLNRLFAVFFWFFLLGPAGAVFYRLTSLYNGHSQVLAGQLPSYRRWQWVLEWLPVRYMALCACLAGNFTTGFHVWRQLVLDTQSSSGDVLALCLVASLLQDATSGALPPVDDSVRLTLMRSAALDELLVRTEIIGLAGLALVILVLG
jgi:AmpE protein